MTRNSSKILERNSCWQGKVRQIRRSGFHVFDQAGKKIADSLALPNRANIGYPGKSRRDPGICRNSGKDDALHDRCTARFNR
jgi:hypothetical protein